MSADDRALRPLGTHIMRDGSRCFLELRPNASWEAVRDHVARLEGATLDDYLTEPHCWTRILPGQGGDSPRPAGSRTYRTRTHSLLVPVAF